MMNIPTSLSFLFLLCVTVFAAPPHMLSHPQDINMMARNAEASTPSAQIDPIGTGELASIYVCEHVEWGGKCEKKTYSLGSNDCVPLDGTSSSVGPDPGFTCTFYKNNVCRDFSGSDSLVLENPGTPDLTHTVKGNFNDVILGFQCFEV